MTERAAVTLELTEQDIRDRLKAVRQRRDREFTSHGRTDEWQKLHGEERALTQMMADLRDKRKARQEEERQLREVTREEAMALVQREDEPPHAEARPTSRMAADQIRDRAKNLNVAVLVYLLERPHGATDEQIAEALDLADNTARARRWTLSEKLGLVFDSGRRRETRAGNPATVWVAWPHVDDEETEEAA